MATAVSNTLDYVLNDMTPELTPLSAEGHGAVFRQVLGELQGDLKHLCKHTLPEILEDRLSEITQGYFYDAELEAQIFIYHLRCDKRLKNLRFSYMGNHTSQQAYTNMFHDRRVGVAYVFLIDRYKAYYVLKIERTSPEEDRPEATFRKITLDDIEAYHRELDCHLLPNLVWGLTSRQEEYVVSLKKRLETAETNLKRAKGPAERLKGVPRR